MEAGPVKGGKIMKKDYRKEGILRARNYLGRRAWKEELKFARKKKKKDPGLFSRRGRKRTIYSAPGL